MKDTSNLYYFKLFSGLEEFIAPLDILIEQRENGEFIYIDKNYDNDYTNDGKPNFFPVEQNEFPLFVECTRSENQKIGVLLQRFLKDRIHNPEKLSKFVDGQGNITKKTLNFYKQINQNIDRDFQGKKGTYYFADLIRLRRGKIKLGNYNYDFGLYDSNFNGFYNDPQDCFYLDLNKNHILTSRDKSEQFSIKEIFQVEQKNYKLTKVDKYGDFACISETIEEKTARYVKPTLTPSAKQPFIMEDAVWELELVCLEGHKYKLKDFKGKYLLLNFWGEWCMPCMKEIPTLVNAKNHYKDNLRILSFLTTKDLTKAKNVIKTQKIDWPQIALTEQLQKDFKVIGYPTNILILPDGKESIRANFVEKEFFENNIK